MPRRTRDGLPLKRSALVCKYFFLYQNRGHACERACDHIHLWLRFSSRARRRLFRRLVILCGIMQNCWPTCGGSLRPCSLFFPSPFLLYSLALFLSFLFYAYLFMHSSFQLLFFVCSRIHTFIFDYSCLLSHKEKYRNPLLYILCRK